MALETRTIDGVVHLEGELTIYTAHQAAQSLAQSLRDRPGAALDLSAVIEMDSAGLQVLLMMSRTAAAAGAPISLQGRSDCVDEVLRTTQCRELTGLQRG